MEVLRFYVKIGEEGRIELPELGKTIKYPKHLVFGVCVAFVLLSAFVGVVASATTWYVEEGESIQAAVDAANQGDTIIVRDGTYTENINMNKLIDKGIEYFIAGVGDYMKRIYLDTCVWCRPFDEPSIRVTEEAEAFFKILQDVDEKRYIIIGSIILDDEIYEIKDENTRAAVTELMTRAVSDRIDLISESGQKEIKKATGVKDEDAFHLTAAIEGKTEYFITVDDNILTKADKIEQYGIKVRNPVDLNLEEAENGYGS